MEVTHLPYHLFLIFTGAVVFSVLVQAAVFVGLFMTVRKATKSVLDIATQLGQKAGPIVEQVGGIVRDAEPKIKTITSQVVEISTAVRDQTLHVNATVDRVVEKTDAQVDKVDDMVSTVLGGIAHAGLVVQSGVLIPVRKAGGLLAGIRAAADSFFGSSARRPSTPAAESGWVGESRVAVQEPEGEIYTAFEEELDEAPAAAVAVEPVVKAVLVTDTPGKMDKYVMQSTEGERTLPVEDELPPLSR
jgi:hypothetical protein